MNESNNKNIFYTRWKLVIELKNNNKEFHDYFNIDS